MFQTHLNSNGLHVRNKELSCRIAVDVVYVLVLGACWHSVGILRGDLQTDRMRIIFATRKTTNLGEPDDSPHVFAIIHR